MSRQTPKPASVAPGRLHQHARAASSGRPASQAACGHDVMSWTAPDVSQTGQPFTGP
jgi:hypothetical protein